MKSHPQSRVLFDENIEIDPLQEVKVATHGNVEYYVCPIKPGKVLYEMEGVDENIAREAFALASAKLPISTTFVKRSVM